MSSVRRQDSPYLAYELVDAEAKSSALVAPAHGGMVTGFRLGAREVLVRDDEALLDGTRKVRGGMPLLFPSPGALPEGRWERQGRQGALPRHGFARDLPWELLGTGTQGPASVTLGLSSSDETMAHYPFPFALEVTYSLKGPKLRVDVRVTNTGTEPMPFGFGLHPYFAVPAEEKPGARVETASLQAYDNLSKRVVSISRVPLTAAEVDMALLGHGSNRSSLRWADDDRVTLEGSKEFKTFVVWSKSDGPFVCLEPWTCGPNALNTGESLLEVPPGETHSLWVTIGATLKQPKPVREYNREEY